MKVLALEEEPSATRGGQEHSLLDVCTGLASAGHVVTLAYVDEGDLLPRYRTAGVRPLRVRGYSIDRERPLRSAADVAASLVSALRTRPDVLYINQYHDSLFAATIARLLRVPLVCHLRLFPPREFCGQWRIGLTGVSRFIAVSEVTRRAYLDRGFDAEAIDLVMNGVDVERFHPLADRDAIRHALNLSPDEFAVLYVGRIDRCKNLEGLLRSFAELHATVPRARLLVAGRPLVHSSAAEGDRYLTTLQELTRSLGVAHRVDWLGPRTDVVQLYNAADVCALLSSEPETFGRTLAEAMACGTPSVGAALGGIPEVLIGEAARFIVPLGDDRAAAACLRELADWRFGDPSLGPRLRSLTVQHFDARRMVRQVAAILERTVAEGAVRRGPRHLGATALGTSGAVVATAG
jgi:glycosyltransferase involved in cell wall biosynthesis